MNLSRPEAPNSGERFGGVEVELAVREQQCGDRIGMRAEEMARASVAGESDKFGEVGLWEDGGDAGVASVGGGGNARRVCIGKELELQQMEGRDGGLIAGEQEHGVWLRVREGSFDASHDGGGNALLPARILSEAAAGVGEVGAEASRMRAEDDEDVVDAALEGDAGGAGEQALAVDGDELLSLAQAGGGAGGEQYGGGAHD